MVKIQRNRKNNRKLKEWGLAFGLALILAIIVRGFFIESYLVSSTKMEKTLYQGDFIFVNKLSYGARLPNTLLSVPFTNNLYFDFFQLPYMRLPGTNHVKKGDLMVFNYPALFDPPVDKKEPMIKRCVGLPGDTLQIENKIVYVNSAKVPFPDKVQFNFRLVTDGSKLNQEFLDKYSISEGGLVSDMGIYDFPLMPPQAEKVLNEPEISFVRELKDFPGENTRYVFPIGYYYSWNKDYFGPLVIPFKGQNLHLNYRNIELYTDLIQEFEQNTLEIKGEDIFINGIETHRYKVKQNYYFVLDDNRDNAKDSRYWGFLPESHLIGEAAFVWFSVDKSRSKIRWNRVFKPLKR